MLKWGCRLQAARYYSWEVANCGNRLEHRTGGAGVGCGVPFGLPATNIVLVILHVGDGRCDGF